jgi:ribosome-binding factor A
MDRKNLRNNEDIHREISAMIRETIKDPRVTSSIVSVVRTELSGDNSQCKVYISAIEGFDSAKKAAAGLQNAAGMIRHELGKRLYMKKSPELKFIADNSIEYSARIIRELSELESETDNADKL